MNKRMRTRIHPWPACVLAMAALFLMPAVVRADSLLLPGSSGSEQLRRPELITVLLALAILVVSLAAIPFLFRHRKQGNMWRLFTGLCATLISMALVGTLSLTLLYREEQKSEEAARQDYQLALQEMKTFPASLGIASIDVRGWSWNPQGDILAYLELSPEAALFVFDPASGPPRELKRFESGSDPVFHAWSEGGDYLICSHADHGDSASDRVFQVIDRQGSIAYEQDLPAGGGITGSNYATALILEGEVLYVLKAKQEEATSPGSEPGSGIPQGGRFELLAYDMNSGSEVAGCLLPTSFLPSGLAYQPEGHISIVGFWFDDAGGNGVDINGGLLPSGTIKLLKIDPATLTIEEEKAVYRGPLQVYASEIFGNPQSAHLDPSDRFLVLRDAGGKTLAFDFRTGEMQSITEDSPGE
jgi:hypothetical protein